MYQRLGRVVAVAAVSLIALSLQLPMPSTKVTAMRMN